MKTAILATSFLATIPAANWLIGNVGTVCVPSGPCLIPVFPGLMAPSGVLLIGAALALRDALHGPVQAGLFARKMDSDRAEAAIIGRWLLQRVDLA